MWATCRQGALSTISFHRSTSSPPVELNITYEWWQGQEKDLGCGKPRSDQVKPASILPNSEIWWWPIRIYCCSSQGTEARTNPKSQDRVAGFGTRLNKQWLWHQLIQPQCLEAANETPKAICTNLGVFVVRGILSQYSSWLSDLKSRQREGGSSAWEEARRATGDRSVDREVLRTQKCELTASCRHWCNTKKLIIFWPNTNEFSNEQCLPSAQVQGRQIPTDLLYAPWCSHGECPLRDWLQGSTNHNTSQLCHWGINKGSFSRQVLWSWGQEGFLH